MTTTSTLRARPTSSARPAAIDRGVMLLLLIAVTNAIAPVLPGSGGDVVFGITAGLITAVAAVALWAAKRWGLVMAVVVAALNLLLDIPALFADIPLGLKATVVVHGVACAVVLVLMLRPDVRQAMRSAGE